MRRSSLALLVLAAVAALPVAAAAQQIRSPYRYLDRTQQLTPYAGYWALGQSVSLDDSTSADFGAKSAPVFGLRYNMRLTGPLQLDVNLAYSPTTRQVFLADATSTDSTQVRPVDSGEEADVQLVLAEAGFRFQLTGTRSYRGFAPFVTAGLGIAADLAGESDFEEAELPERERFDFGTSIAFGAGVGTDWFLGDRLSVRADATGRLWRYTVPPGFVPRATDPVREWVPSVSLTLGGAYHF